MDFVNAIGTYHVGTSHGLSLDAIKDLRRRVDDLWLPELVMDDVENSLITFDCILMSEKVEAEFKHRNKFSI